MNKILGAVNAALIVLAGALPSANLGLSDHALSAAVIVVVAVGAALSYYLGGAVVIARELALAKSEARRIHRVSR